MKLTADAEVEEVIEDSYSPGVSVVKASAPVEDQQYFEEADEYVFTTRSRWARNFREAGIVPRGAGYNPVDHAMRNDLDDPILEVDDENIKAALFVRDQYEANDLDSVNEFEIEEGDHIGRFGAYNTEEVGVNPGHFSEDFSAEEREARQIVPEGQKLDYDEIKDPAVQPTIDHLSEREGLNTARNVGVASLDDRLLEPSEMEGKREILDSDLSDLVQDAGQRPETVGPGNYLAATEGPAQRTDATQYSRIR
jgi:hypothetical protein